MTSDHPLATVDQAVDHQLSQLGLSFRFILDVTPVDADDARTDFVAGRVHEPVFTYRELGIDPEVAQTILDGIDDTAVEDNTVATLLRGKRRELELQLAMLRARDTPDFRALSLELYGGVAPKLLTEAQAIIERVPAGPEPGDHLDASEFLLLAEAEIDYYREIHPDIDVHAEIRHDSTGVMVSDNVLLIGPGDPGVHGEGERVDPARDRHPPRHPGQRLAPAAARAGHRPRRIRRDPGGPRRAR